MIEREVKKMTNTYKINNKGYITATQYAKIKGISKQAVYQQFDNSLKEQVIKLHGMKVVPLSMLTDEEKQYFQEIQAFQAISQENQQENQGFQDKSNQENKENQQENQGFQGVENQEFQGDSAEEIAFLRKQIAEKDKQIETLLLQLANAHNFDTQLAELIHNSQVLLLNTQKALPANSEAVAEETPHRKGFFSRFSKKNK